MLDYILELFTSWPRERERLEEEILKFAAEVGPRRVHPDDLDAGLRFWLRHPFPPTLRLRSRLLRNHGINTFEPGRRGLGATLVCEVSPGSIGPEEENEEYIRAVHTATVTRAEDIQAVLFSAEGTASVRSYLATNVNLSLSLLEHPSIDELAKMVEWRAENVWNPLGPAVNEAHVAYELAQHSALKAVEDWARTRASQ